MVLVVVMVMETGMTEERNLMRMVKVGITRTLIRPRMSTISMSPSMTSLLTKIWIISNTARPFLAPRAKQQIKLRF
jgi:hypothetical protein